EEVGWAGPASFVNNHGRGPIQTAPTGILGPPTQVAIFVVGKKRLVPQTAVDGQSVSQRAAYEQGCPANGKQKGGLLKLALVGGRKAAIAQCEVAAQQQSGRIDERCGRRRAVGGQRPLQFGRKQAGLRVSGGRLQQLGNAIGLDEGIVVQKEEK